MIGASRTKPGSIAALIVSYFCAPQFLALAPATQQTYRLILEKFRSEHGDKPVALLTRQHINAMLANKVTTPAAANHWLRMVKSLMVFAVEEGWRGDNPTVGIRRIKNRSAGFHTWDETEIENIREAAPGRIEGKAGAGPPAIHGAASIRRRAHGKAARSWRCSSCSTAEDRRHAGDPVAPCPRRHHRGDTE